MTCRTKFFQVTHIGHWMKQTIGAIFKDREVRGHTKDRSISQFQSLCTALAATVGTGNIVGVAGAIMVGGPGAVFWMWLIAFSTCLGWSHYGSKACEFLFGEKITKVYQVIFVAATFGGAVMGANLAWDIADTLNGMMMLPNLVGVLVLSPVVVRITKNYVDRKLRGRDIEPMLSNFEDIQKEAAADVKAGGE